MSSEIIWLTGASTGIGRSLAVELAGRGHTVIASARGAKALEALAKEYPTIKPLPFDVTDREKLDEVRNALQNISPYLDRVILNAGTCEYLDTDAPDWRMMERVMNVNFFGTVNSLEVAMPLLRQRPQGNAHIVGVVSQAAFVPFPRAQAYGSSKAAMQYFLDSLRVDLVKDNIDVTVINPGFVKTPLTDKNDFDMPFLVTADVAAKRMADAIARRPTQYDFPSRLKYLLKTLGFFSGFWNNIVAPKLGKV